MIIKKNIFFSTMFILTVMYVNKSPFILLKKYEKRKKKYMWIIDSLDGQSFLSFVSDL